MNREKMAILCRAYHSHIDYNLPFILRGGPFIFQGGGGWANTKENSCTAFAEEIKYERKLLHSFWRRNRNRAWRHKAKKYIASWWTKIQTKPLVMKKNSCRKKLPPPPRQKIMVHPLVSLASSGELMYIKDIFLVCDLGRLFIYFFILPQKGKKVILITFLKELGASRVCSRFATIDKASREANWKHSGSFLKNRVRGLYYQAKCWE